VTVELKHVGETPVEESLPRLDTFVSPIVGIVNDVVDLLPAASEPTLHCVGCTVTDATALIGNWINEYTGSSKTTHDAARAAGIGEALERYSASFLPDNEFVTASAEELGPEAVDPERFALFVEDQWADPTLEIHPFRRDTVVRWVRGFAVPSGEPVWLPVQLVYMSWTRGQGDDTRIGFATSSGVACGPTLEEAVLTSLLELIERDAVMLAWHNRLSLPLLDWSNEPEIAELDARYFRPAGLPYSAVDLSVFMDLPAVLGIVHGIPGQLGALGIGASAASTVREAWLGALAEAFSVQRWTRDRALERPEELDVSPDRMLTFDDHTIWYASHERAALAAFLDASPERRDARDVRTLEGDDVLERIEAVCRRLESRGCSAYAVDITAPDVREGGFRVVHAVVPELVQLDVVAGLRFLGARRLYHAAHEAGLVPRPLTIDDLNPHPHPFP
jgi:ribosomal protein S12 methylthiotransferase accessory factor